MCPCKHHFDKNAACTCRCGTCEPPVDPEGEGGCPCYRCGKHHPATTCAEPEAKDDLYVEPEPLKEGDWPAFNDDDVHHLKVISGSTTVFDGLAVFEEADNGNINVTPVPRCTSLVEKAGSILRCGRHEGHSDGHWTVGSTPAAAWSDERAYGRVVEGGAS